jgi:hypothetical protein
MFKLKKISEFINESESNDLHKCYLALKLKNGHQYWSYKKYASDKFFIPVTEDNIDEIELDFNLPILNYSSEITKKMLDKGCKPENVYNKPEHIKISGSKKKFHEYVGEDENLPATVYTQSAAIKIVSQALQVPLIQILANAGLKIEDIYKGEVAMGSGYNLKTGKMGDLVQMGVIDPLKVTRCALQNAVSVAITILSTNAIITMARTYESNS